MREKWANQQGLDELQMLFTKTRVLTDETGSLERVV